MIRFLALIALLTTLAFAPRLQPLDGVAIDPHGGSQADIGCGIDPNGCQQSNADRGLGMDPNG